MGLSRGRGISLVSSLAEVQACSASPEQPVVVQRYLTAPLLIQVGEGKEGRSDEEGKEGRQRGRGRGRGEG